MQESERPIFTTQVMAIVVALLLIGMSVMWARSSSGDHGQAGEPRFERTRPQFIAVLGDPTATSGSGAEDWGLWSIDPGPRGVRLKNYGRLEAAGGVAPDGWQFDETDWWLDENGTIMEKPVFPVPPGRYLVTGLRDVTAELTVRPPDEDGRSRWELSNGATLHDVTHLPCRSARYTPESPDGERSPRTALLASFPVSPGGTMPPVAGYNKQDYTVLVIVGVDENN